MRGRPYNKREERAMVREMRLRELGYQTYNAYLRSAAWRDVKERYRASDLPQICMCGDTNVQLHHTTYERVGREHLEDLVPLCQDCHTQAHILEAEGVIGLDLQGFYYDPERAAHGKMLLAQLAAVCPDGAVLRKAKRDALNEWQAQRKTERGRMMGEAERERKRQRAPGSVRHHQPACEKKHAARMAQPIDLTVRAFDP